MFHEAVVMTTINDVRLPFSQMPTTGLWNWEEMFLIVQTWAWALQLPNFELTLAQICWAFVLFLSFTLWRVFKFELIDLDQLWRHFVQQFPGAEEQRILLLRRFDCFFFQFFHCFPSRLQAPRFSSIECVSFSLSVKVAGNLEERGQNEMQSLVENKTFNVPNPEDDRSWERNILLCQHRQQRLETIVKKGGEVPDNQPTDRHLEADHIPLVHPDAGHLLPGAELWHEPLHPDPEVEDDGDVEEGEEELEHVELVRLAHKKLVVVTARAL